MRSKTRADAHPSTGIDLGGVALLCSEDWYRGPQIVFVPAPPIGELSLASMKTRLRDLLRRWFHCGFSIILDESYR